MFFFFFFFFFCFFWGWGGGGGSEEGDKGARGKCLDLRGVRCSYY